MIERTGLLALLPDDPRTDQTIAAYELVRTLTAQMRALRRRAGLSQKQLGEAIGVSQGRISQIESGLPDEAPNLDMVARYAAVCGYQLNPVFSPLEAIGTVAPSLDSAMASAEGAEVFDPADPLEFLTGPVIEVSAGGATETAVDLTIEKETAISVETDQWIVIPQEKA